MTTIITRMSCLITIALGIVMLAACGSDDSAAPTNSPTGTHEPSPTPETVIEPRATLSPVLLHLQQDYENLSVAHEAMTAIWESLATGGTAQCGDYPALVTPDSISAEDDPSLESLAAALRQAAVELDTSLNLWQGECTKPRTNPAPDVIQAGRLAARSAGDSLRTAAFLLGEAQSSGTN